MNQGQRHVVTHPPSVVTFWLQSQENPESQWLLLNHIRARPCGQTAVTLALTPITEYISGTDLQRSSRPKLCKAEVGLFVSSGALDRILILAGRLSAARVPEEDHKSVAFLHETTHHRAATQLFLWSPAKKEKKNLWQKWQHDMGYSLSDGYILTFLWERIDFIILWTAEDGEIVKKNTQNKLASTVSGSEKKTAVDGCPQVRRPKIRAHVWARQLSGQLETRMSTIKGAGRLQMRRPWATVSTSSPVIRTFRRVFQVKWLDWNSIHSEMNWGPRVHLGG